LCDEELEERLHGLIDRLLEHGIGVAMNETVPERLAYRYLLEELREGIDAIPGMFLDGCDGCCETCLQLPYCPICKPLRYGSRGGARGNRFPVITRVGAYPRSSNSPNTEEER
jgi:hypothetical protein